MAGGIIITLFLVGGVGALVFCIFFGRKRRLNRPHIRNLVVVPPSRTTVVAVTINKNNATPTPATQGRSNQTTGAYPPTAEKNSVYPQLPSAYQAQASYPFNPPNPPPSYPTPPYSAYPHKIPMPPTPHNIPMPPIPHKIPTPPTLHKFNRLLQVTPDLMLVVLPKIATSSL